jgi:hypothetical protein
VVDPETPRAGEAATRAFFGATVRYANAAATERVVSIVGTDEVDLNRNRSVNHLELRPRQRDSLAKPIHLTKFNEAAHEHSRPRARLPFRAFNWTTQPQTIYLRTQEYYPVTAQFRWDVWLASLKFPNCH